MKNIIKKSEEMLYVIHEDLPREGPGDDETTSMMYNTLTGLPEKPSILDVGCGSGAQSVHLAKISGGEVLAVENYLPFLERLQKRIEDEKLENLTAKADDMCNLEFDDDQFDVIWCEGAIYIYGFEKALYNWKKFIKTGGYIVCSNMAWYTENPPEEVDKFLSYHCTELYTVDKFNAIAEKAGYEVVKNYNLTYDTWMNSFYLPLEKRLEKLRGVFAGNYEALARLDYSQKEIDLYRKYHENYGYTFYVMKKL